MLQNLLLTLSYFLGMEDRQNSIFQIFRMQARPSITKRFWTAEFNRILRKEYKLRRPLDSIFLDTYFHTGSINETRIFNSEAEKLWQYANSREAFQCE